MRPTRLSRRGRGETWIGSLLLLYNLTKIGVVYCDTINAASMRFQPFALIVCALVLHGQTPLGTVSGLAVDASGGAVAAASVTLTNNDTGVRRSTATNSSGAYAFPDLPPGTYRLGADAKGFRALETRAFPVDAYRTVRQDLKFEVASVSH